MSQSPSYEQITFGVDLVEACRRELDLLAAVDRHAAALTTPGGRAVRRAIRRYETCWLPLAAAHLSSSRDDGGPLAPALDVHWVWHVHMLAPYSYDADVRRLVGCVVDHRLLSAAELDKARQRTRPLWTAAYPHEPFDVDLTSTTTAAADDDDGGDSTPAAADYTSQCSYDLESAIQRQSKFHYQVAY